MRVATGADEMLNVYATACIECCAAVETVMERTSSGKPFICGGDVRLGSFHAD
jgi:hypothetical protein